MHSASHVRLYIAEVQYGEDPDMIRIVYGSMYLNF